MPRLRRTSPDQPGWTRRRAGRGFVHLDETGRPLPDELADRCKKLVIPPAWKQVWICPHPNGHLQAVGTDDAGRRQYLYHPVWTEQRAAAKHERVLGFGRALPRLREKVTADLAEQSDQIRYTSALAVRMLDLGCFRIGNDVYNAEYGSFGLTTLGREHVRRQGGKLIFEFVGKSGVEHHVEIDDPIVVPALERLRRRRNAERLFSYCCDGTWRSLSGSDVNDYLREASGVDATAKDFRTWHATVLAAAGLATAPGPEASKTARNRAVAGVMREVADFLGNTPTLARSSYVDPRIVDLYDEGRTIANAVRRKHPDPDTRQLALERATLRLLKED
ncbi:DNA topoisomerase IB [Nocardioides sp. zg-ZUI104]|uniref:DNA topoisomerase IB n=1 Tax=Nocardioides faecalis TaxID=2803858 RepID=UPI001BCEF36D|nr:DNA topoisomerase IB [Nocardioides faecalis]MBS4751896.1 DNA topoisomerase IB [Nocardioides faecalis]